MFYRKLFSRTTFSTFTPFLSLLLLSFSLTQLSKMFCISSASQNISLYFFHSHLVPSQHSPLSISVFLWVIMSQVYYLCLNLMHLVADFLKKLRHTTRRSFRIELFILQSSTVPHIYIAWCLWRCHIAIQCEAPPHKLYSLELQLFVNIVIASTASRSQEIFREWQANFVR